jgi:hypothetical protein
MRVAVTVRVDALDVQDPAGCHAAPAEGIRAPRRDELRLDGRGRGLLSARLASAVV